MSAKNTISNAIFLRTSLIGESLCGGQLVLEQDQPIGVLVWFRVQPYRIHAKQATSSVCIVYSI